MSRGRLAATTCACRFAFYRTCLARGRVASPLAAHKYFAKLERVEKVAHTTKPGYIPCSRNSKRKKLQAAEVSVKNDAAREYSGRDASNQASTPSRLGQDIASAARSCSCTWQAVSAGSFVIKKVQCRWASLRASRSQISPAYVSVG
jgi:hypothetical protein